LPFRHPVSRLRSFFSGPWSLASCFFLLASSFSLLPCCSAQEKPKKPKGKDGLKDPERRTTFLAGESAAEARALIESNNPLHIDAVARFFREEKKPYRERLAALRALSLLREQDDEEYRRVYPELKTALSLEASRGLGSKPLSEDETEMLLAAISWHADLKYDHARAALEQYVDSKIQRIRTIPLPARVREGAARLLAKYAPFGTAREVLWATLVERWEKDSLRRACFDSLKVFDKDWRERILAVPASPKDSWLTELQKNLSESK